MLLRLRELDTELLQEAHVAPSIFNFYQSDFQPGGKLQSSGLVAPEAQILNTPTIVHWLNGLLSLVEYGMTSCERGFGMRPSPHSYCDDVRNNRPGYPADDYWAGNLTWMPSGSGPEAASEAIRELDLLLTGGRLSHASRVIIEEAFVIQANDSSRTMRDARNAAVELMASSPEFNTLGGAHKPMPKAAETADVDDSEVVD